MEVMETAIIVAMLSLIGNLTGSYFANNKTYAVMQEQIKETRADITTLSDRVNKHNNLVERMAVVEQSTKSAHHRINGLESKVGGI